MKKKKEMCKIFKSHKKTPLKYTRKITSIFESRKSKIAW